MKRVLKKVKNPFPFFAAAAVAALFCVMAALICAVLFGFSVYLFSVLYLAAAVGFFCAVCLAVRALLGKTARFDVRFKRTQLARRVVRDYGFRTMAFSFCSFVLNFSYALFNGVYGVLFHQLWYVALAVYYLALGAARGLVVVRTRRISVTEDRNERERRKLGLYRLTGALLIVLTLALEIVLWAIRKGLGGFRYRGVVLVVAAVYTVCKTAMAAYNIVKAHAAQDLPVCAARNINFAAALVSVFALHMAATAFLDSAYTFWANAALGTLVCAVIVGMGLYMLARPFKKGGHTAGECLPFKK